MTAQGYRRLRCRTCGQQFNESSGGVLDRTCLPSDIIAFVVFCRLGYRLTPCCLSEIMALRGIEVSHDQAAKQIDGRYRETKRLPVMDDALRKRRHGKCGGPGASWHVDETYPKVRDRWTYLYRAIDRDGSLVNAMLKACFRSARLSRMVHEFGCGRIANCRVIEVLADKSHVHSLNEDHGGTGF